MRRATGAEAQFDAAGPIARCTLLQNPCALDVRRGTASAQLTAFAQCDLDRQRHSVRSARLEADLEAVRPLSDGRRLLQLAHLRLAALLTQRAPILRCDRLRRQ